MSQPWRLSDIENWIAKEELDLSERIRQLEQNQSQLIELLHQRDQWIADARSDNGVAAPCCETKDTVLGKHFGRFTPGGAGFKLASTRYGDMNFSAWTYVRYLNREGLDKEYTDAFGRTFSVDQRNDIQLNKVNLYFKGWIYDPKLLRLEGVLPAAASEMQSLLRWRRTQMFPKSNSTPSCGGWTIEWP